MISLFDHFNESLNRQHVTTQPTQPTIPLTDVMNSITHSKKGFIEKMNDIENMNEQDLYTLISDSFDIIIEGMHNSEPEFLHLITNYKFLNIFTQVVNNLSLTYTTITNINKIIYDYINFNLNMSDYMKGMIYNLARVTNKSALPSLLGMGIPDECALQILIARYSTEKDMLSVKRVNNVLLTLPIQITDKIIAAIYERIYSRMTIIFEGTMFDVQDERAWTNEMIERRGMESLAILNLLENMPMQDIRQVLISYVDDYYGLFFDINNPHKHISRFPMTHVNSEDFPRINNAIAILNVEGVSVP